MSHVMIAVVSAVVLGALAAVNFDLPSPSIGAAAAQHHDPRGSQPGTAVPPHRQMQMTLDEIDRVVSQGLGAGMAFAADQNGYPGPTHVLELREQLRLTPAQEARVTALRTAMFPDALPKSAHLGEAEAGLRRLFAEGAADEARVRAAVAEVERARSEVRLVHLLTHLQTRVVLTEEQRRLYHEARWGK